MYKVLGISDEVTVCECCGRTNLKKTVVLSNGDGEVRYGTECAARAMKIKKGDVEKAVRSAEKSKAEEIEKARRAEAFAVEQAYGEWLARTYGDRSSNLQRWRAYKATLAS